MVQVIREENPQNKLADALGLSLGQGLGTGLNTFFANRSLESVLQDKGLQGAPISKKLEALRSALTPYGEVGQNIFNQRLQIEQQELNEMQEAKQLAETARQEGIQRKKGKALANYLKTGELSDADAELFTPKEITDIYKAKNPKPTGGITGQATPPEVQQSIGSVLAANKDADADQLALAMDQAGVPRAFSNSYIESRRRKDESAEKSFERGEKFEDEMLNDYNSYLNNKNVIDQMSILIDKGNLTSPLMVKLLDSLGIPLSVLENPDSEQFDKLSQELMKNITGTYGSRILKVEVDNFLKSIPSLMNSEEGKRRIVEQWRILSEGKKARYDAYRDVIRENPGKLPRDYKLQTYDRAEKRLNELSEEFKKLSMGDVRQKVPQGTPVDESVVKKYMSLSGNNPDEAARMALEDGYEF